jgi:hypothetical protein
MAKDSVYQGACFCGAVRFTVTGEPAAMGYCHCNDCRRWSAGPVNGFVLWPTRALEVTSGTDRIGSFQKTPSSVRKWCKTCGGHLFTEHPQWDLIDVYSAVTPDFPFSPGLHVFYESTVLHIHDGLPKLKDLPAEMGGSGATLPE